MPILHSKHLEHRYKGHSESLVVGARELIPGAEIVPALENLAAEQRVDEDKDEHENGDQDKVHEGLADDSDDHGHGLETAEEASDSQDAERSEDSDCAESL